MMQGDTQALTARRAAYLEAAAELRKLAYQARSAEMQQDLMRLVVLYEELAEYTVSTVDVRKTTENEPEAARGKPLAQG